MSFQNITWPQVALIMGMLGATFVMHHYMGLTPGMAMGMVTTAIAFLLGRPNAQS